MKIEISGIEELRKSINVSRIQKSIAQGVGQAAAYVHAELRIGVNQVYKAPSNLDSVFARRSISYVTLGKNVIQSGVEYKQKAVALAKYFDSAALGNIPPLPKLKEGWVHKVEIRRGRKVIVTAKYNPRSQKGKGYGGFIPRKGQTDLEKQAGKAGKHILLYGKGKGNSFATKLMFERETKKAYPLRQLFGPSLANLALTVFHSNRAKIDKRATEILSEALTRNL